MRELAISAAQKLVANLGLPAQAHAVWVQTTLDDNKVFQYQIMVSKHPNYTGPWAIPTEVDGFQTSQVKWPDFLGGMK